MATAIMFTRKMYGGQEVHANLKIKRNMKKYIYAIVAAFVFFTGCKDTNENLVQERGVAVVPAMSDPAPAYFTDNIEESYVEFDLSLSPGETVDKTSIEVARGNKSAILRDVTLPITKLKVTASEVLKALNIPANDYNLGDIFYLYVLTTKDGKTTRSTAAFPIPVVCYFAPSMLAGNFYYVSASLEEEGSVTIEADPNNPLKVYISGLAETQGAVGNGNRIELNVNPNNFNVSGPKTIIAGSIWGYSNYAYQAVAGSYSACDDAYTITFSISVDQGSFGNFVFVFTRE